MKKYLLTLSLALNVGAADYDLIKGIDLTGITGGPTYSQLNQLVDNGIINTNNKGLIFVTAGNTNPTATPFGRSGMTNFLWLNRNTDPPLLYAYSSTYGWTNVSTVGSVGTAQLVDGAVTGIKIANQTITDTNIFNGTITQTKLSPASYTSAFLQDGAIASNKIANAGIQSSNIAPLAITAALIATNTITSNQVALGGLSWTNMQGAMPSNWLGADAVNGSKVLDGSLTSNEVATAGISYTNLDAQVKAGLSFASAKFRGTDGACYASNNVASITRISPGYYTLTFNVNASSTNYNIYGSADSPGVNLAFSIKMTNHPSVSSFNFIIHDTSGPSVTGDATNVMINVFGGY